MSHPKQAAVIRDSAGLAEECLSAEQCLLVLRGKSDFGKKEEGATESFELEKRLALEKRILDSLAEIDHALDKFADGSYGRCDSCGQLIEPARLEALPQATLCLECKARQAKNTKGKYTPG